MKKNDKTKNAKRSNKSNSLKLNNRAILLIVAALALLIAIILALNPSKSANNSGQKVSGGIKNVTVEKQGDFTFKDLKYKKGDPDGIVTGSITNTSKESKNVTVEIKVTDKKKTTLASTVIDINNFESNGTQNFSMSVVGDLSKATAFEAIAKAK